MSEQSRRSFLSQAGLIAGAGFFPTNFLRASGSDSVRQDLDQNEQIPPADYISHVVTLKQIGWNIGSHRFIDPPVWTWEPFKDAAGYMVMVAGKKDQEAHKVFLKEPRYDMSNDWDKFDYGGLDLIAWAVDKDGNALCAAWPNASAGRRFYKSQDFNNQKQTPLDWSESVQRTMAYLLAPARDKVYDFEKGLPRTVWSCSEDNITGQRRLLAFPALHFPNYIMAYLLFAKEFPDSKHIPQALTHATLYADWLLEHRQPADWRCSLMPYSTIENGKFEGYFEGKNIMLFRAARVGEAMVEMYHHSKDQKYLDYAKHIANVLIDMQNSDGSWPLRVDPRTGEIKENYTSAAITPARLMGLLEAIEPDTTYENARRKAFNWVLNNPVLNKRWEGAYEDVRTQAPYKNLQNRDANETIWYLAHYHYNDKQLIKTAEEINRFIEDQFVVFHTGDDAIAEIIPVPTVLEQYSCYRPMEAHTATWIRTLIALHRSTGNELYLAKAINAANSIVSGQQETGAYSSWGYDKRFKRPLLTIDWPGSNATAVLGLLTLNKYIKSLPGARTAVQPL